MRDWEYRHYVANSLLFLSDGSRRHYLYTLKELMNKEYDTRSAEEITEDVIKESGIILLDE